MYQIKNLKYKEILDIPSLIIDRSITCIVGASGSGKTTLLRHLNRLYKPDEGEIFYNNKLLSDFDPILLRRQVVMLGQTPIIYDGTIEDNLQIGLQFSQKPLASSEAIHSVLEKVDLHQLAKNYCDTLSGGEKQRLCLARIMLMNAETYLLDEPSAALDSTTELFILESLSSFVKERGGQLIIVTHSSQIANLYQNACIQIVNGHAEGYNE